MRREEKKIHVYSLNRDELLIDLSESGRQRSHSVTDLRVSSSSDSGQHRGSASSLIDLPIPPTPVYGNVITGEIRDC